tara:strand:+ start:29662 stop:30717 length:1056 start_codon:yes stop_codon:yes gene_type:complete
MDSRLTELPKKRKPMPYRQLLNTTFLFFIFVSNSYSADFFQTNSIKLFNNGPILNLFNFSRPDIIVNKEVNAITLDTQFELSNYISSTSKNGDQFYIDGENWVLRNTLSYQVYPNFIVSASIPWIKHTGGKSDSFIYKFHDIFQLPQNGRQSNNENDFRWILINDGETLLDIDNGNSAWGDLSITGQLTPQNSPSVRWSFMTKFPTGDYDKQTGSEKFDIGLSFAQINPDWFQNRSGLSELNLAFWYGSGVSYIGEIEALKTLDQNTFIFTFRTGFAYSPINSWHLKCQLDAQSSLFKTEIRELGWYPLQISISTLHHLSPKTKFEFVIIEDIRPRSAPDIIFQTSLKTTF